MNKYTIYDYPVSEEKNKLSIQKILENKFDLLYLFKMFVKWVDEVENGYYQEKDKKIPEEEKDYLLILRCMLDHGLERNDVNRFFNDPFLKLMQSKNIGWKEKYYTFLTIDKFNLNYWIYPKYSNSNPIHLLKYIEYIPTDEYNHILHKTLICKMNNNNIKLTNGEINFTSLLFLYQAENLLNPMQYSSSDWDWLVRGYCSDGGGLDNNITLKSIKVMLKDNPDLIKSIDNTGKNLLHYLFLSPNYDTTCLDIRWVNDLHQQKIEKLKLQADYKLFIFQEIYNFCKTEGILECFENALNIIDQLGDYPFDIISSITAFKFLKDGIDRKDNSWMEMMVNKIKISADMKQEWEIVYPSEEISKVISKVEKFKEYISSRNQLIFMKVEGKALPLIPKDVNKYIISRMLFNTN